MPSTEGELRLQRVPLLLQQQPVVNYLRVEGTLGAQAADSPF